MINEIKQFVVAGQASAQEPGNVKLIKAIDNLIDDLKSHQFEAWEELKAVRKDADKVHNDGFYFFDIHVHRTMVLIELDPER